MQVNSTEMKKLIYNTTSLSRMMLYWATQMRVCLSSRQLHSFCTENSYLTWQSYLSHFNRNFIPVLFGNCHMSNALPLQPSKILTFHYFRIYVSHTVCECPLNFSFLVACLYRAEVNKSIIGLYATLNSLIDGKQ